MSRPLGQRATALVFAVPVVIVMLVGGATWTQIVQARTARAWSQHATTVIATLQGLELALRDAETGQRGYLLTTRDSYLAPYEAALARIAPLDARLAHLAAGHPWEQARLHALAPLVQGRLDELARSIALQRSAGPGAALALLRTDAGLHDMARITAGLDEMVARETTLLSQRLGWANRRGSWARALILVGFAVAVLALVAAAWWQNRSLSIARHLEVEQRLAAARLRASLDSLSQGVAVFDADLRLSNWNECFQSLLHLPEAIVRTGTAYAVFEARTATDGAALLEGVDRLRGAHEPSGQAVMYERTRTDGHQLELRRSPMPDGGFVLTIADMTHRAQAEAVGREAQKMQAIGQLTGGIGHDFNNLLTVILGNLEMTQARLDDQPLLQRRIERATWAAQRGAMLTTQLLAFARKQPLAPAAIDLAATVTALMPELRRALDERVEIRTLGGAGLWLVLADPARLETALLNLALNARDAMPGGGRLTIGMENARLDAADPRLDPDMQPGDYVVLALSDTGCGMSAEVAARAFEPFFTTGPDGSGAGLGLAMVFGFVKQSGGHVSLDSRPGEGTTVRLALPRPPAPAGSASPTGTPAATPTRAFGPTPTLALPPPPRPADPARGRATVLVVEDEPAVREIAIEILADLGYRVLEARDGEEGLGVFARHAVGIDLLLTDMVLPGQLQGRDLAQRALAMRPATRLLFMSGGVGNQAAGPGRRHDAPPLLGKPFTREQLSQRVAEALDQASSEASGRGTADHVDRETA